MRATIHTTAVAAEVMDAGKLADKDRPAHSTGGRDRPGPGGEARIDFDRNGRRLDEDG